jgi:YD repeat-containing protein
MGRSCFDTRVDKAHVTGASAITYQPMNAGMSSWTSSNGVVNTLGYDIDGRLTGISAGSVQSLGFSYDLANRIIGITNGINNSVRVRHGVIRHGVRSCFATLPGVTCLHVSPSSH